VGVGEAVGVVVATGLLVDEAVTLLDGVLVSVGVLDGEADGELRGVEVSGVATVGKGVQVINEDRDTRGEFSIIAREMLPKRIATETRAAKMPNPTWRKLFTGLLHFGFWRSYRQKNAKRRTLANL